MEELEPVGSWLNAEDGICCVVNNNNKFKVQVSVVVCLAVVVPFRYREVLVVSFAGAPSGPASMCVGLCHS